TITITPDFTFDPDNVTIDSGDVVLWRNASRSPQTVTADPDKVQDANDVSLPEDVKPFDSGVINPGDEFALRFDAPGDYTYVSLPRESDGMSGNIFVRP